MRQFGWAFLGLVSQAGFADAQPRSPTDDSVRFVVLGHIRGNKDGLSPRLGELVAKVRTLHPAFAVLTGDIIWGDVHKPVADPASIEREWNAVDSALAALGIPIYRVPGNHDISDIPSRDVWLRRYGSLPNKVVIGDIRLLLLSSAWIPADGDTRHNPFIRGFEMDSTHIRWLGQELSGPDSSRHTFAFMHHLLWWQPDDGRWWKEVHPILAKGGVRAVFSGDYGPLKFSTMERDRVRYYQSSIENPVLLGILQNRMSSRLLSAQFDNFFEVVVGKDRADVRVHTLSEISSGEFTPQRFRAIQSGGRTTPLRERIWGLIGTPPRLAALVGGVFAVFLAGFWVGRRRLGGRTVS